MSNISIKSNKLIVVFNLYRVPFTKLKYGGFEFQFMQGKKKSDFLFCFTKIPSNQRKYQYNTSSKLPQDKQFPLIFQF